MNIVIEKPIISEKTMKLSQRGIYTFLVDREQGKYKIAQAIKERFSVDVISVKTVTIKAQQKRQRSRKGYFIVPSFKKAIIQVKKGQKIPLFEQASAETQDVKVVTAEGEAVTETKERKSLLSGTKVKIEKTAKNLESKIMEVENKKRSARAKATKEESQKGK